MKKKKEQLSKKDQEEALKRLFTAASAIKTEKQMKQFLQEILTHSEQLMLGRRVWIAQMLLTGHTHQEICERLETGPSTVRRVGKWLDEKLPGYADAVASNKNRTEKGKYSERVDPTSFYALRRKYPTHFLLFNIAEAIVEKIK